MYPGPNYTTDTTVNSFFLTPGICNQTITKISCKKVIIIFCYLLLSFLKTLSAFT